MREVRTSASRRMALMVAHQYWPRSGAATLRLRKLTEVLVSRGYDVTVLSLGESRGERLIGPHGERIIQMSPGSRARATQILKLAARALIESLRHGYDVVISDPPPLVSLSTGVGARLRGAQFLFYYCDSWSGVAGASQSAVVRKLKSLFAIQERFTFLLSDVVATVTEKLAEDVRRRSSKNGRVVLVPNGTDLETFTPDGEAWSPPHGFPRRYFVYAGTCGIVHGAEVFLEGAEELWERGYDFGLVFMGFGTEYGRIESRAREWGPRVLTMPRQTGEMVASVMRGALGALSSMKPIPAYSDARPTKTLAGLACGAPAVYVGEGLMADEVRSHALGFAQPWSVDGAREVMRAVLELSPEGLSALRQRCRRYALKHYDQASRARVVAVELERARQDVARSG